MIRSGSDCGAALAVRVEADDLCREAAAAMCEALADDTRNLRVAAEAYFGGDFRAPEGGG